MARLIALGASNLTRGFSALVNSAGATFGGPIEVFGALGHGRSYGTRSTFLFRSLPGILESGLWARLGDSPPVPSHGFITDVGNDILYEVPVSTILSWVGETATRLERHGSDLTLTDMPLFNVRGLSPARFALIRSVLVPSCRLPLSEVIDRATALNEGLVGLAEARGRTLVRLRPEWYAHDPIHIRPRCWGEAWREILLAGRPPLPRPQGPRPSFGALGLYFARPDRRWLFGMEQRCPQPVVRGQAGTAIWLY